LEAFSAGTIQLGAANTYAGRTNIGRSTFEVSVLANAGTASSLGTGSQVSTIDMNDTNSTNATVSTLRYVGTADAVTDRAIRMYTDGQTMPSLAGVLENNGTGSVKFTSAFTAAGSTTLARTFRLSGTNTGANEIVSMTDGPSSTVTLDKAGVGRWTLTGNSTYTGGTTVSAGTLQLGNGGTAGMVGGGDVAISSGAKLVTNRSDSFSINNNITGAGSVIVGNASGGAATLTSNANTYSGGTTVNSGTLVFTNVSGSATGSGTVTVTSSATLAGTGRIAPAAGNPVLVQGTLSVGQTSGTVADMEITTSGAGTLFMDTTSVLLLDLVSGAGSGTLNASTAADMLVLGGTMTLNSGSTLRVQNLNGLSDWAVGDAWKLIDWNTLSGTASGTFTTLDLPVLGGGLQWDSSALYSTGVLSVIAVPEPSRLWVLAAGLSAVLIRRRRC
jgi:autotransporter-associated beta strand protein